MANDGVDLVDVFVVDGDVVTGGARLARQAQASAATELLRLDEVQRRRRLQSKRQAIEAQIAAMQAELAEAVAEVDAAAVRDTVQSQGRGQRPREGGTR
jgi:circadian clock protein KaiC